jgi:hypothetical protein
MDVEAAHFRLEKIKSDLLADERYETSIDYTFNRIEEVLAGCSIDRLPFDMEELSGLVDLIEAGSLYPDTIEIILTYLSSLLNEIYRSRITVYNVQDTVRGAKPNQYLNRDFGNSSERYVVIYENSSSELKEQVKQSGRLAEISNADQFRTKVAIEKVAVVWIFGIFSQLLRLYHRRASFIGETEAFDLSVIQQYGVDGDHCYASLFDLSNMQKFKSKSHDWDYVRNYEINLMFDILYERNFAKEIPAITWTSVAGTLRAQLQPGSALERFADIKELYRPFHKQ